MHPTSSNHRKATLTIGVASFMGEDATAAYRRGCLESLCSLLTSPMRPQLWASANAF